jgi:hypothetical protein
MLEFEISQEERIMKLETGLKRLGSKVDAKTRSLEVET